MIVDIREIRFGSKDYDLEVALRDRSLRQPLGLRFSKESLAGCFGDTTKIEKAACKAKELKVVVDDVRKCQ